MILALPDSRIPVAKLPSGDEITLIFGRLTLVNSLPDGYKLQEATDCFRNASPDESAALVELSKTTNTHKL